jgi:sterol 24-C-methyltransferase
VSGWDRVGSAAGLRRGEVAPALNQYRGLFDSTSSAGLSTRKKNYETVVNNFYDLVTDFYEFGWGDSFHFAPRRMRESFWGSIRRCERTFSDRLGLRPGMTVLDVGCGVGGPMREVARYSGARVVGINNNAYQVEKAEAYNRRHGLADLCSLVKGDFLKMSAPDGSFDAAFAIESMPHAPEKLAAYREILRVLKPGGLFALHEWCLTELYDPSDLLHRRLKAGIEVGNGLPELVPIPAVLCALSEAGFEILESWDAAQDSAPETPWYRGLEGRDFSLTSIPRMPLGRRLTKVVTGWLEGMRVFPSGTKAVSCLLNDAADDLVAAGRIGIFTPLFFALVRRPVMVHRPGREAG